MSYNGTVRCSHCYRTGHNKRKCPELSEQIKGQYEGNTRMAAKEREAGNENDAQWYDDRAEHHRQLYLKRTKIDLATGEKVSNKAAKAARMKKVTCGYCHQRGHTRRSCKAVKVDKQVFVEETRRARIAALETARETGVGLGSMIPIRSAGYDVDGEWRSNMLTLRYIKSIAWDTCTSSAPFLAAYHVEARKIAALNQARWTSCDQIAKLVQVHDAALRYAAAESEPAPMSSLVPTLDPPKGWLQPTEQSLATAIKREFPTTGTKHNKQRGYAYTYPSDLTREVIKDLGLAEHYDHVNWA